MTYRAVILALIISGSLPALAFAQTADVVPPVVKERPALLIPLYVAFATAQALDLHSSRLAISRGAREINPVLTDVFANHTWAAVVLKAGVTGGVVFGADRLRRRHPRQAIVLMVVLTAVQFGINAHNYRVASGLR